MLSLIHILVKMKVSQMQLMMRMVKVKASKKVATKKPSMKIYSTVSMVSRMAETRNVLLLKVKKKEKKKEKKKKKKKEKQIVELITL